MGFQIVDRNRTGRVARFLMCALLLFSVARTESSDGPPRTAIVHPLVNANFKTSGDPACLSTAVEVGNPATGSSTVILKSTKGCLVRWHFHSAEEQLIVVEGRIESGNDKYASGDFGSRRLRTNTEQRKAPIHMYPEERVPDVFDDRPPVRQYLG